MNTKKLYALLATLIVAAVPNISGVTIFNTTQKTLIYRVVPEGILPWHIKNRIESTSQTVTLDEGSPYFDIYVEFEKLPAEPFYSSADERFSYLPTRFKRLITQVKLRQESSITFLIDKRNQQLLIDVTY